MTEQAHPLYSSTAQCGAPPAADIAREVHRVLRRPLRDVVERDDLPRHGAPVARHARSGPRGEGLETENAVIESKCVCAGFHLHVLGLSGVR